MVEPSTQKFINNLGELLVVVASPSSEPYCTLGMHQSTTPKLRELTSQVPLLGDDPYFLLLKHSLMSELSFRSNNRVYCMGRSQYVNSLNSEVE